jgi:subtilisin family serine protease
LGLVTGTGTPSGLSTACNANKPDAGSLVGEIALISRGVCTFSEKIRNAQDAGAIAVLVVNNVGGDASAMARGGIPNEPTVPAYMVSLADGTALKANDGVATTISATKQYFQTPNSNLMSGSSSMGPTDVDFRVKPDVVAPGVNVLSSQPQWTCNTGTGTAPCWAFFSGTSMATPHLAGIAAVVRGQHPSWSAAEIRSAIVNTADEGVLKSSLAGPVSSVNTIGTGRANAASAVAANVALDPVSLSFGSVASGSGQSMTKTITLSNLLGAGPYTATVSDPGGGVTFTSNVSGNTINITMSAAKGVAAGPRQGILRVSSGGTEVAHAAVFVFIK